MSIALVLKYWKEATLVALVVILAGLWHAHNNALIAKGRAEAQAARADSVLTAVGIQRARVDTVYRQDTVRLVRLATRYDTVRDTVSKHLTDTAYVDRFVTVADSAIHACRDVLGDCKRRASLDSTTISALNAKLAAVPVAARRSCVVPSVVSGAVGLIGGVFIRR